VPVRAEVERVYRILLRAWGPQGWWPARTRFEVMAGAVLTQNTAWTNVEKALANLREAGLLDPEVLAAAPGGRLARLLRPSGYFNVKADRLRSLCRWILEEGGLGRLSRRGTGPLRESLLGVRGVGPETADDILLYAFGRPVFVIDAYTRRLFSRLGFVGGGEGYEELRALFEGALEPDPLLFGEYHALIVRHAKEICRTRPRCQACRLRSLCPSGREAQGEV
jgi:endonuclease-3 related protein